MKTAAQNALSPFGAVLVFVCIFGLHCKGQNAPKMTYDGYRKDDVRVWFNAEQRPDKTFRITLSTPNEGWLDVQPDSHFVGYSVRLEQKGYESVAYLHSLGFPMESEVSVTQAQPAEIVIERGTFGCFGQLPVTASVGDTFSCGQDSVTVLRLSPDSAMVYLENEKTESTLPLSAVGSLRSEIFLLEKSQERERRMMDMTSGETEIRTLFSFIIFGDILVFGFILVGMLTLPRFVHLRPRSRRISRD